MALILLFILLMGTSFTFLAQALDKCRSWETTCTNAFNPQNANQVWERHLNLENIAFPLAEGAQ